MRGEFVEPAAYADGTEPPRVVVPTRVAWLNEVAVTHVACGTSHTMVVTETGQLYGFGNNEWGQLGVGSADETLLLPTLVIGPGASDPMSTGIVFVACGDAHTVALAEDGQVYTFGLNSHGKQQFTCVCACHV